jgi:hypothetical protein
MVISPNPSPDTSPNVSSDLLPAFSTVQGGERRLPHRRGWPTPLRLAPVPSGVSLLDRRCTRWSVWSSRGTGRSALSVHLRREAGQWLAIEGLASRGGPLERRVAPARTTHAALPPSLLAPRPGRVCPPAAFERWIGARQRLRRRDSSRRPAAAVVEQPACEQSSSPHRTAHHDDARQTVCQPHRTSPGCTESSRFVTVAS